MAGDALFFLLLVPWPATADFYVSPRVWIFDVAAALRKRSPSPSERQHYGSE